MRVSVVRRGPLTVHFRVMADLLFVVNLGRRGLLGGSGGTVT